MQFNPVERKVQAGDSLTEILNPQPLEYKMAADYSVITKRVLHPAVIQALKEKFSARNLAKIAKLNRSVISRALGGRYIQSKSWCILMRLFEGLSSRDAPAIHSNVCTECRQVYS